MQFIKELIKDTNEYLEIREIGKDKEDINQHFIRPDDIMDYKPPADKNVYFGVYSRAIKSGKAKSCSTTRVLWADFDEGMRGLTVRERMEKVKSNIEAIGFPKPSIIVSSGNGIHTYWLLDKRVGDGAVEVVKLLSKATNGDVRVAEKARVMRLPGTLNIKNINEPLKCEIIQADYSLIYNLESFKDILKDNIGQVKENPPQVNYGSTNTILDNVNVDRSCINLILKGVGEGERNFALGRLTKWLQIKGSTKSKSQQIILAWNNLNDPPEKRQKLIQDFNHYWHGDYKLLGCAINNPHIQQLLNKYCNRPECKFSMAIGNIQLDNTVKYNNRLLNDLYKLTGNDLILYGLLVRYKEGLFTSLLNEKLTSRATRKPCISKPTRLKSLNKLKKIGFIDVIEGNRRAGKENLYKAIPQGNLGQGYTLVSNGAINGAIDKRVTSAEFKLYVLLLKYAFNKGSCYPSLNTMAKELRTTSSNVSIQLKRLEKSDYIKRIYKVFNGNEKLDIRLLV